jgi:hypothetical protein
MKLLIFHNRIHYLNQKRIKMPDPSKWLSNLWIIENNSGVCAFEESFMEINLNPELISGFLIAMINFGKELASKDLQSIQFNNLKILLKMQPKYTIAVAVTDDAFSKEVELFIELIIAEFDKHYLKFFENWAGRTDVFNDFGVYLEKLTNKESIGVQYLKSKVVKAIEDHGDKYKKFAQDNIQQIDSLIEASKTQIIKFKDDQKDIFIENLNKLKKKMSRFRKIAEERQEKKK